jgi:repressor LexA
MTPIRYLILRWIATYCEDRGYSPSRRELCLAFRWASPNAAQQHIDALARLGLVAREEFMARTLTVTEAGHELLRQQEVRA